MRAFGLHGGGVRTRDQGVEPDLADAPAEAPDQLRHELIRHRPAPLYVAQAASQGSFSEQFPLLFRDYLRTHADDAAAYENLKRSLSAQFAHDRAAYTDAKAPFFWEVIRRADQWAQQSGWEPGPSDA